MSDERDVNFAQLLAEANFNGIHYREHSVTRVHKIRSCQRVVCEKAQKN